ncbi:MAG: hypothetical protein IJ405_02500 [Lachnospiraceae bacterium]|nr:hypothetical protein [Lachnospiraceae bacterium]
MKKKLITLIMVAAMLVSVLGACGAEESSGDADKIVTDQNASNEIGSSLTEEEQDEIHISEEVMSEETITEKVDYIAEAQKQWAAGNYEEAAIQYQNEYQVNGNQHALVELLDMWIKQGNDAEVKRWASYIRSECVDMTDELRGIVERSEKIQWIPIVVTHTQSRSGSSEEVACATNLAYDEAGNIIQSNIAFHRGGFGYLSNEGAYYTYEYLGDDKVKVVTYDPIKEKEEEQYKYEELNTYANYMNMTVEDMFNCDWDELSNRALDAGVNPDDIQMMMQKDTYYDIYCYDENGWLITEEKYRNDELYLVYDYYYDMSYDISLGQDGMQTEQQVRIYERYIGGDNRNWEESFWYSDKKVGMFAIIEGDEIVCDEYGNIVYRRSSSYNLYGDKIQNASRIEYVYCTPEEYMVAKESGDFSAYKIGTIGSDTQDSVYPFYVYDEEGLELRCKEYLGTDYAVYEPLFEELVSSSNEPFIGLDEKETSFMVTNEMNDRGLFYQEALWGTEESLDEYDFVEIGLDEGGNTMGAEAVYFYEGTKVVYRLNTKEPSFFVVDYKNHTISDNTQYVDFGDVFYKWLYLVPSACNKREIAGFTVYFSYVTDVYFEWDY